MNEEPNLTKSVASVISTRLLQLASFEVNLKPRFRFLVFLWLEMEPNITMSCREVKKKLAQRWSFITI